MMFDFCSATEFGRFSCRGLLLLLILAAIISVIRYDWTKNSTHRGPTSPIVGGMLFVLGINLYCLLSDLHVISSPLTWITSYGDYISLWCMSIGLIRAFTGRN